MTENVEGRGTLDLRWDPHETIRRKCVCKSDGNYFGTFEPVKNIDLVELSRGEMARWDRGFLKCEPSGVLE